MDINIAADLDRRDLFGNMDRNLKRIEEEFKVEILQRDNSLTAIGKGEKEAVRALSEMMLQIQENRKLNEQKIEYIISLVKEGKTLKGEHLEQDVVCYTGEGKPIAPKTIGQKEYVRTIRKRDLVFAIGPAGTGKTYLAVAMAINEYRNKRVEKIILTRPAVEAGEKLGFLPGDLNEKIDPYLRPIYDALNEILGRDNVIRLREKDVIEIVPLAYMRGRTLEKAFIILDEAQNTTREQMKMFLTRMGFNSKMVITGDITQIDLPEGKTSGLIEAKRVLRSIDEIGFCHFKDVDVVRHSLVKKIIGAYERFYLSKNNTEKK